MNMMRNKNRNNNRNNRGGGGGRRYNNNGGGNRQPNDGQNIQRQKHHATQMREKYNNLVREAQNNGDRVDVEYYLQHVEHYNRILAGIAEIEAERYAQYRETQAAHAEQQPMAEGDAPSAEGAAEQNTVSAEGGEAQQGNYQPRHQRQPRRHYQSQQSAAQPATDNGAEQANSNNSEIPLPGSILPPI